MSRIVAKNLAVLFREAADRYGDLPAFAPREGKSNYGSVSYRELYEYGLNLGTALIELGVEARDHVALLSDNRVEWNIADYAVLLVGAADVPRGTDVTNQEIEYILDHSDSKVAFVENKKLLARVLEIMPRLDKVKHLILMEAADDLPEGVLSLYQLVERGRVARETGDRQIESRIDEIKADDLFTLIYTSGTTGTPKGVQLQHSSMVSQIRNLPFYMGTDDRLLSILPVWHSYERVFQMVAIGNGCCTYFTTIRTIGDDLKYVKPTMMASAPRLWESMYLKILKNVESASPLGQKIFKLAYFSSRMVKGGMFFLSGKKMDLEGRGLFESLGLGFVNVVRILLFILPYLVLNQIVLKKLRQVVGGCFRGTISGGGALQPHVDEFFNYIGIPVLEGYGLTETCPVLAVRDYQKLVIGTVGPIFEETKLRVVDPGSGKVLYPDNSAKGGGRGIKGEIHVSGPQIMKGYYKQEDATKKILVDGWINTGDLGMYTYNDCLKIMGRSKDTVVLLNGENVEPIPIEAKICESSLVDQCVVVGQDQKFLSALVVPSEDGFESASGEKREVADLAADDNVVDLIKREVKSLVSSENGFKSFEYVQDVRLLPKAFEIGDEMTNTFKIKRYVVDEKYANLIEDLYS
ncbi:AMP-binding protein [Puniceicoccaceae bacterium K14]|nr:AMP-binding protein [Puniceicoccaceae bacterium K14]